MKVIAFLTSVGLAYSGEIVPDEAGVSLLQHSVRTIRKIEDPPGAPPPGVASRQAARREARKISRAAGREPSDVPAAQLERRRARRSARRAAKKAAHAAGNAHFNDGAACDTCASHCTSLFTEVFESCMVSENCQPWQKEDGPTADKCKNRCDRTANWRREPCIRECQCDVDLLESKKDVDLLESNENVDLSARQENLDLMESQLSEKWVDGLHRCQDIVLGETSLCPEIQFGDTEEFDSIKKCAKKTADAGGDTFNFYRTAKEFAKCSIRQCRSADLKTGAGPTLAESPAGRGTWKTFSSFCAADTPVNDLHNTGSEGPLALEGPF